MIPPGKTAEQIFNCRKCINCKTNRSNELAYRMEWESKDSKSTIFLTLTYDDQHLPFGTIGNPTLRKDHHQKFIKRLRKAHPKNKIRYRVKGEYGPKTLRPHYHYIIWDISNKQINLIPILWKYGNTKQGYSEQGSIKYMADYITKSGLTKEECQELAIEQEFEHQSSRPTIGAKHLKRLTPSQKLKYNYETRTTQGQKVYIPEYYKKKIFPETKTRKMIGNTIQEKQEHELRLETEREISLAKIQNRKPDLRKARTDLILKNKKSLEVKKYRLQKKKSQN